MTAHAESPAEAELPPLTSGAHTRRIGVISIVACLGGLLFGYDTGVANGAEGPMARELGLSLLQLGVVISALLFAAAIGALVGGIISDAIGRRKTTAASSRGAKTTQTFPGPASKPSSPSTSRPNTKRSTSPVVGSSASTPVIGIRRQPHGARSNSRAPSRRTE